MHFRNAFGVSPVHCSMIWAKLQQRDLVGFGRPVHLLWALILMKQYAHESILASLTGVHPNTFNEWAFYYIEQIAKLKPDFVSGEFAMRSFVIGLSNWLCCRSSGRTAIPPPSAPMQKSPLTAPTVAFVISELDTLEATSSRSQHIDMRWRLPFSQETLYGQMDLSPQVVTPTLSSSAKPLRVNSSKPKRNVWPTKDTVANLMSLTHPILVIVRP